jgi:hypothetical protein
MTNKTSSTNSKPSSKTTKAQPKPPKKTAKPAEAESKPQKKGAKKAEATVAPKPATKKAAELTATEAEPREETKKAEAPATPKAEAKKAAEKVEPKASAPRARDPRLPAPGTVLQKLDRQGAVRCECKVEADGVHYEGTTYRSLSSAAMAASKDLGLGGRATNGYLFWGLIRQPAREADPVTALEHAWERFRARAEAVLKTSVTDENRTEVVATVEKHADALERLRNEVARAPK